MCAPAVPKVEPIPDRRAAVMPDGGNPDIRQDEKRRRRLAMSSMIFTNQPTLGAPSTSGTYGG